MIINGKHVKAKDIAELANVSRSTICRHYSMPREDYEDMAKKRRRMAYELRNKGLKWQQVADKIGCSYHSAVALYRRYLALDQDN